MYTPHTVHNLTPCLPPIPDPDPNHTHFNTDSSPLLHPCRRCRSAGHHQVSQSLGLGTRHRSSSQRRRPQRHLSTRLGRTRPTQRRPRCSAVHFEVVCPSRRPHWEVVARGTAWLACGDTGGGRRTGGFVGVQGLLRLSRLWRAIYVC